MVVAMIVIMPVPVRVMRLAMAMRFDRIAPVRGERLGSRHPSRPGETPPTRPPVIQPGRTTFQPRCGISFKMPLYYKWPAYVGNVLLLLSGLIIVAKNSTLGGGLVVGLAALNLYLVWKLDVFSREEVWLETEIRKAKMREELQAMQERAEAHAKETLKPAQLPGPSASDER